MSGIPVGQPVGGGGEPMAPQHFPGPLFAPQDTGGVVGTSVFDPTQMAPLYMHAQLAAQAWPVQALLESLRRQYLGG